MCSVMEVGGWCGFVFGVISVCGDVMSVCGGVMSVWYDGDVMSVCSGEMSVCRWVGH